MPTTGAEEVRRVAAEILSRPEFRPLRPTPLDRVVRAFLDALGRVLEVAGGSGRGSLLGTAIVVVAVTAVAVVALRFGRTVRRDVRRRDQDPAAPRRDGAAWRADAEAATLAGRWRVAVRCLYRALVADLAGAGLVEEVPGRTAGEYLAAVRAGVPRATQAMVDATAVFERAWYGSAPTTEADVTAFRRSTAAVLAAASVGGRGPGVGA